MYFKGGVGEQGPYRAAAAADPGRSHQLQQAGGLHPADHGDGGGGAAAHHACYTGAPWGPHPVHTQHPSHRGRCSGKTGISNNS